MDRQRGGWMDGQREGMEGWKDGRREGAGGEIGGWVVKGTDGQRGGRTEVWVDGETGEWMGGRRDGRMDRGTDRQTGCSGMPTAQPGFHTVAGPDPHQLPRFPRLPSAPPPGGGRFPPPGKHPGASSRLRGGPQLPRGSRCPHPLVWGLGLGSAHGWHPGPRHPCASSGASLVGGGAAGPASRRWWQRGFSPAVADSRESHVLPG